MAKVVAFAGEGRANSSAFVLPKAEDDFHSSPAVAPSPAPSVSFSGRCTAANTAYFHLRSVEHATEQHCIANLLGSPVAKRDCMVSSCVRGTVTASVVCEPDCTSGCAAKISSTQFLSHKVMQTSALVGMGLKCDPLVPTLAAPLSIMTALGVWQAEPGRAQGPGAAAERCGRQWQATMELLFFASIGAAAANKCVCLKRVLCKTQRRENASPQFVCAQWPTVLAEWKLC